MKPVLHFSLITIALLIQILVHSPNHTFATPEAQNMPLVRFDKNTYQPFDKAAISIEYPSANNDESVYDVVSALISTSSGESQEIMLTERHPDSGIFISEELVLTPVPEIYNGDLFVQRDDDLIIEFTDASNNTHAKRVDVNFYGSGVTLGSSSVGLEESLEIFVWDIDMNRRPHAIDTLEVRVWSITDKGGLLLTLRESADSPGIFHESIWFTEHEASSGTRLRASPGDIITVKYTDNTLPFPASLKTNGFETVDVLELFASAILGDECYSCSAVESLEISLPILSFSGGKSSENAIKIAESIEIASEIRNLKDMRQEFVYVLQVTEREGVTAFLSMAESELGAKESVEVKRIWMPKSSGNYQIQLFLWKEIENPVVLSPMRSLEVSVT